MSEATAIGLIVPVAERRSFDLTPEQWKNLALASLGSLLEFYEFMVFGFFTVVIGKLFFPPDLPEAVQTFRPRMCLPRIFAAATRGRGRRSPRGPVSAAKKCSSSRSC